MTDPHHWEVAWLQVIAVVLLVVILHVPLGNYMARVYTDSEHWRVERVIYRVIGALPDNRQ
jgi:K+-transporting ATPase ATPase A chain